MKRTYFIVEWKRGLRSLPVIVTGMLLLLAVSGLLLFSWQKNQTNEGNSPTVIGVAVEPDEPYMELFVQMLGNLEHIKDNYTFSLMSQEEAESGLTDGSLSVAFFIPKNYILSMIQGTEEPITLRFGSADPNVTTLLLRQLSQSVSLILLNTEAAIYSMDDYYLENALPNQAEDEQSLNIEYIRRLFARHSIFETQELEAEQNMHYSQYYLTVGLLLFLLLAGLLCPGYFKPQNRTFVQKLQLHGLSDTWQLLLKQLASCCLFSLVLTLLLTLLVAAVKLFSLSIPDFSIDGAGDLLCMLLPLYLLLPMICALHSLVYEWIPDTTASILFLFLSILLFGYLSGYFYPISFLPECLQHLAAFLPTRVLFLYAGSCICQNPSPVYLLEMLGYTLFLYGILWGIRKKRLEVSQP